LKFDSERLAMETTFPSRPRSLQIAVIGSTYPRTEDDYEVPWLRESVNRIARRGHQVTVIAPSYAGLKDHLIDGIEVRRFRYAPARWEKLTHGEGASNKLKRKPILKLLTLTYVLSGIWSAWKVCREKRIDILHVQWPFPHGLMALLPAWLNGVRVVSSCHSAEIALAAGSELSTGLLATCLRRSAAVTANSRHTADLVHKISGVNSEVIPYGVTVRIEPRDPVMPEQADVPLLLFSGRLIERKGVNFLLRAMPLILAKRRVRLVITGDGHCRAEWEALSCELGLTGQVEFAGFVSKERLSEYFRSCTIYVHPAINDDRGDTEGLGVVLIEALRNRRPVVASRVGGIVDVIQDESTGLLVSEKNPAEIAAAVLRLLADPALSRRLGDAGFAYATRFFDWGAITDRLEGLYQRVCPLKEPPSPRKAATKSIAA
jgi:glycosyltransferase involved in cell wall biosynthesis